MYLVAIAWLYVALMMAVAEATHVNGSILGAMITFVLYGLLPIALVMYLLGTPARKRALRERQAAEHAQWLAQQAAAGTQDAGTTSTPGTAQAPAASAEPDAGGHAPAGPVTPEGKKP